MRIGYACQIAGLRGFTIRTCRLADATPERLAELAQQNLNTLLKLLQYNQKNEITLFRISSDIIPFGSHPVNRNLWWESSLFSEIGAYIRENGMRVSMHPGQYTVLNAEKEDVARRAEEDVKYHCRFLDALGLGHSHKVVLHIGGAYGDKEAALMRFVRRAQRLPEPVLRRLVVENDDKVFDVEDVLRVCRKLEIPAVFDALHHACNHAAGGMSVVQCIRRCAQTWSSEDGTQKIHYAQQRKDAPCGVHARTIGVDEWLAECGLFEGLDVMLEVKDKNRSAIKCKMLSEPPSREKLDREWARYKYLVMRHSQRHYQEIRALFRKNPTAEKFFRLVDEALQITPTVPSVCNAAQHIWGYFKKQENPAPFTALLEKFRAGTRSEAAVLSYLYRLAVKWHETYLLDGYSFDV